MAENTHIEWCDHSFNPWIGCQKVAPECDNCYAEAFDKRFHAGAHWGAKADRRRTVETNWKKPRSWNRKAVKFYETHGRRQRVFCASWADVFDNAVDPTWRTDLWDLIRDCPDLDWLLLTKRPQNIRKMLPDDWGDGWAHVWMGTSAGYQKTADTNIPALLDAPAAVRFVSCEPMLGPVDLTGWFWGNYRPCPDCPQDADCPCAPELRRDLPDFVAHGELDWIICGGESGPNARPMHPEWARSLRDQCAEAGVPFLFKQWGEWMVSDRSHDFDLGDAMRKGNAQFLAINRERDGHFRRGDVVVRRVGKKRAGRVLDGVTHDGFPVSVAGVST